MGKGFCVANKGFLSTCGFRSYSSARTDPYWAIKGVYPNEEYGLSAAMGMARTCRPVDLIWFERDADILPSSRRGVNRLQHNAVSLAIEIAAAHCEVRWAATEISYMHDRVVIAAPPTRALMLYLSYWSIRLVQGIQDRFAKCAACLGAALIRWGCLSELQLELILLAFQNITRQTRTTVLADP